ncbi:HBL366Wp [Eremothecium sinecaudum]|uniref:HBL366Wp n=1 Tax=Eremothecium sinecaudum TaxID=45286 RepID=A0A109UVV9_9SACH|nr:HBL366Wp [Eremothecium sinecaudum]AMD18536.1 HBL366Wp [Eremothecium sinecaudum]
MVLTLKKLIPHIRVLPEEDDLATGGQTVTSTDEDSKCEDGSANLRTTTIETDLLTLKHGVPYELRDEGKRSWWKFFNEFEYRNNSEYTDKRKWYTFIYPHYDTQTPAERRLLFKLDIMLALYCFMLCWSKTVDLYNFYNTYVSGMKEDLHMKNNDYSDTSVYTKVGSIVFLLPFMYILPRWPSNYVLPAMDLGWSIFTIACSAVHNLDQLKACRFMVAAFGAGYYPVTQYVLGSWYAADELTSRVYLFFVGQLLGIITAGFLQADIYKALHDVWGIAGWRWMYLINGVAISLPTAIIGFYALPGVPSQCYSIFLTDEEIRIARSRNERQQIKDTMQSSEFSSLFSLKLWKRVLTSASFWILLMMDLCSWNCMTALSDGYGIWLHSMQMDGLYSTIQVNNLSTLPSCLGFVYVFICAVGVDFFRSRWFFLVLGNSINILVCGLLIKWEISTGAKWTAFLLSFWSIAATPCLWSMINDIFRMDPQIKAISWVIIYSFAQATYTWVYSIAWKTEYGPKYRAGYISSLVFAAVFTMATFVALYYYKKQEKKHALGNGIILYDSSRDEDVPEFVNEVMEKRENYYYLKEASLDKGEANSQLNVSNA